MTIVAPADGDLIDPDWASDITDAINDIEARLTADEAAWTDWVPTLTNLTKGSGGLVMARYKLNGKDLKYRFRFTYGTGSAVGTSPRFTLPNSLTPHSSYTAAVDPMGDVLLTDAGTANRRGSVLWVSGSTMEVYSYSTTGLLTGITASIPQTWGPGDVMSCRGSIEVA